MVKQKTKKTVRRRSLKKSADIIKTVSDEYGNNLVCRNNGKRIVLSLKLTSETRRRRIGVINLARKTIEIKRKRDKHLFKKVNGYGFNYKLLEDSKMFDKVRLIDEHSEWLIPKAWIMENGKRLFFLKRGFELQVFVPLSELEPFIKEPKF